MNWLGGWLGTDTASSAEIQILANPISRNQAFTARITIDPDFLYVFWKINNTNLIVYDPINQFAGSFVETSSIVIDGDDVIITILPNGGWWSMNFLLSFIDGQEITP